jgi:fucose permease
VTGLSPVPALRSEKAPAERGDSRRAGWALDALSLGSFVALGLPDGMLGTAWPSARQTFGAPIADLGLILLISTIGAISVSAFVGPLIRRFGVAVLLACSAACAALAGTGYALAPHLWVLFAVAVLWGLAAGMMDGGLNTAVGLSGRSRLLNLLHAAYGVGTAIGPLLVTAAILLSSWRSGYLVLAVLDLVVTALWLRQRRQERAAQDAAQDAPATEPAQAGQAAAGETAAGHPSDAWSRRRSGFVVAAGMSIFFVYTGVEVAAGQWEASFCRGHLGLSASAAGLATFGFWGALTAGRLILAVLPRPVPPSRVVWWGSGIAVAAAALIWWQPGTPATLAAFVLLGGALAGVFPALIALTPLRIGRGRSQHAIAWQVGAAAGGGSGLSALIGLLIGVWGLSVLGPSLTVLAVLLVAGIILLERTAPIAQPAVAAGPVDLRIGSRRRYLGRPDLTAEVFDEEGYYRRGDAVSFADPEDPAAGLLFRGRLAEDFKLSTGTFVRAGALRTALLSALPMLSDAVITGENRDEAGALAWLNPAERPGPVPGPADGPVLHDPALAARLGAQLATLNAGRGSASRITRLLLLTEPPSLDAGEITDKG